MDRKLFDVTELLDQGLADARSATVPVVSTGETGRARVTRSVDRLGLRALRVAKDQAGAFWREVAGAVRARGGRTTLHLDTRVHADLDVSVPKTGATVAWQAGHTGTGVPVAVLDTGYDPGHPDLAGKVRASANFTADPDVVDGAGHGTHVASTIAGTGAASGGRFTGVAPGASLLVGKVLDNSGNGFTSDIIAGLSWAVEQGAKVVNMSLGSRAASDGTDVLAQAVNDISEKSGALVVVSAGNTGPSGLVGSPGAADRALTVANTTKDDQLNPTSSRGPRLGDHGLKPELAAPGTDIVAARAKGTLSQFAVDEHYAKISGTSMAAPHVAGAAAIVRGQHPDWTADQVKAALTGSAQPLPGTGVFDVGTGRVDLARATRQALRTGQATLGFGALSPGAQPDKREITFHNDGDRDLELRLDLDATRADGSPTRVFTVDSRTLRVPARGKASATVTLTPGGKTGKYSGVLRASAGENLVRVPVAADLAAETKELVVHAVDRLGVATDAAVLVQNEQTGHSARVDVLGGAGSVRVPEGTYRVLGQVFGIGEHRGLQYYRESTAFAQRVRVSGESTSVSVDARQGKPVTAAVAEADARPDPVAGAVRVSSTVDGRDGRTSVWSLFLAAGAVPQYSIGGPHMPGLALGNIGLLERPMSATEVLGAGGFPVGDSLDNSPGWRGDITAPLVDVGDGADPGDVSGKIALLASFEEIPQEVLAARVKALRDKGARFLLAYNYVEDLSVLPLFQLFNVRDIAQLRTRLAAGPAQVRVRGQEGSPYAYFLAETATDRMPDGKQWRLDRARMPAVDTEYRAANGNAGKDIRFAEVTSPDLSGLVEVPFTRPLKRVEHFSPGRTWRDIDNAGPEISAPRQTRSGERGAACWGCGPVGAQLPAAQPNRNGDGTPMPWVSQRGNRLSVEVPMLSFGDPDQFTPPGQETGRTTLSRDGRDLGSTAFPGQGEFDLTGDGTYRLRAEATRGDLKSTVDWTFQARAGRGGRVVAPLLDVRYQLPLDGTNTAPVGPLTGHVAVAHQSGSAGTPVRDLGVEVSYDGGGSWQRATVAREGDRWRVVLPGGGTTGGAVSLRATATDLGGNAVTETVLGGYRLR
ncbi:S8 family peptidase [Crossiella equi]|uniref:S8 family peptidase n=1 Tax=Crossiella equi TaxID=130796 RepID=UPI001B800C0D|nr:S8 family serine peptidase [Crossiella equi]